MNSKTKPILFWQFTKNRRGLDEGCFSQWAPYGFVVDGLYYRCAEQYMMAQKAKILGDMEKYAKIMGAKSPRIMKQIARSIKTDRIKEWDNVKFDVVICGNLAKFSQRDVLRDYLLKTGDAEIVEASPKDAVWGIGIAAEDALNLSPEQWPGKNMLGKAIMEVRKMLKEGKIDQGRLVQNKKLLEEVEEQIREDQEVRKSFAALRAYKEKVEKVEDEKEPLPSECEANRRLVLGEKRSSALFVMTRKTLLQRVNAGDRKAFREFYDLYCPAMLKFLGLDASQQTEQDQWDIVQTVFERFYKNFAMVEDRDTGRKRIPQSLLNKLTKRGKDGSPVKIKFRQYLITMMKNARVDLWNRKTQKGNMIPISLETPTTDDKRIIDEVASPEGSPLDQLSQKEERECEKAYLGILQMVEEAFLMDESLDDCTRDVFYGLVVRGESADELAKKWCITKNNVHQIKKRNLTKAQEAAENIYSLLVSKDVDIKEAVRRLWKKIAKAKSVRHVDKFLKCLARELYGTI